jgi:hypothetical protein
MDWEVFYIIGKLLKRRCLKWACMTHLDIWNISYGQKKGWKSNWQFDFWPLKVENQPDLLACRWHATHCWKGRRRLQLCFRPHLNLRFACEVMVPKIARVAILAISRLPLGSPGKKGHLDVGLMERYKVYYKGKVVTSPKSGPWWILWVQIARGSS